jgi:hypothetical protein
MRMQRRSHMRAPRCTPGIFKLAASCMASPACSSTVWDLPHRPGNLQEETHGASGSNATVAGTELILWQMHSQGQRAPV